MKKQNGVTLVALTITIVVLLILTFTISMNIPDISNRKKKSNFENDMRELKEEIDQYYAKYEQLPIINKYTKIDMLNDIKNVNDDENYYVIDLSKIFTNLNYGKDYEKVKTKDTSEEIAEILDVYIINEQSHTIYYPKGIEYDGEIHYTLDTYTMIKVNEYVNAPKLLEGMTPIKFTNPTTSTEGTTVTTVSTDENWYSYANKKWANAQTKDGSMWVWIPRYAYKITYYTDDTKQTISKTKTSYGSIDVVFLIGTTDNYYSEDGSIRTAQRQKKVDEIIDSTKDYTVHPAFTDESSISYANGGWDKELTGIWVAKFEAGYASGNNSAPVKASNVNYSQTTSYVYETESTTGSSTSLVARNWLDGIYGETETAIKYPTFQGTTYVMNYINNNDVFKISKALTDSGNIYGLSNISTDSHLMKNSEWGAVAYLSKSKYGKVTEITSNNINLNSGGNKRIETKGKTGVDSVYAVTGCTSNTTDTANNIVIIEDLNKSTGDTGVEGSNGTAYKWNQKTGQNASTTGNIYGIYDMNGGIWKITANFISNGNAKLLTYGKELLDETKVTYTINEDTKTITPNTGKNTKYVTIYPYKSPESSTINTASQNNLKNNTKMYGDAIRETTSDNAGTSNSNWNGSSWNGDYSIFPAYYKPFLLRGGNLWGKSNTGIFAFANYDGNSLYIEGFRAVLVNQ